MNQALYFNADIGNISITEENGYITHIDFNADASFCAHSNHSNVLKAAILQLDEYFSGKRHYFQLPVNAIGTSFQMNVWKELCKIDYGSTLTYKAIAQGIGKPKAFRAVGNAIHSNPVAIIIPCHRVIGSNGSLCGFAGGLNIKQYLLDIEKKYR